MKQTILAILLLATTTTQAQTVNVTFSNKFSLRDRGMSEKDVLKQDCKAVHARIFPVCVMDRSGKPGSYIGIGWELGRAISKTDWYTDLKENYWYPYRMMKLGY